MAYNSILASVPEESLLRFRQDMSTSLSASYTVSVSHLIAYWVQVQPLGWVLGEAIDGGDLLQPDIKHPLRAPIYHVAGLVPGLHHRMTEAHKAALTEADVPEDDWYETQIRQVIRLLAWAEGRGEAVVSLLEPPYDYVRIISQHSELGGKTAP